MNTLLPLVTRLKACPTHNEIVSRELLIKCWEEVRQEKVTRFIQPSTAIMAALVFHLIAKNDNYSLTLGKVVLAYVNHCSKSSLSFI